MPPAAANLARATTRTAKTHNQVVAPAPAKEVVTVAVTSSALVEEDMVTTKVPRVKD
jgi:hypothetical protein